MEDPARFPVVVIIPSLNPDDSLKKTVMGCQIEGFSDFIIVDDGSRESCQPIFQELEQVEGCVVLHHTKNQGKGRALKTAFAYYLENYDLKKYQGVVTADADGQHLPEDIYHTASCLDSSEYKKLILGCRDFNLSQVPFKSRNGNKITTEVFHLLYGKRISDTQTGLRALSNSFVSDCLTVKGERFEYEINMLIDAVLQKISIQEVVIETVYFNNNRETHFRPVMDSMKIYRVMFGGFLRFTCSGLLSVLIDQGLFALLQKVVFAAMPVQWSIPLSTLIARVFSSYFNFSMNRAFVFHAEDSKAKSMVRYYVLCVVQMAASAALVTALAFMTHMDASIAKILIDTMLFFVSYRIQRAWVFKGA